MGRESACDLFYRLPCVLAMESECHSVSLRDCRDMSSQVAKRRDRSHTLTGAAPTTWDRTLQPYGGRFLTSGKLTALEGNVPQRFVIIAFDSVEKARGWYDSPAYQPLVAIRQKTATSTLFIAEGLAK
jgi:uncharacterized protein (DUF1330 family)